MLHTHASFTGSCLAPCPSRVRGGHDLGVEQPANCLISCAPMGRYSSGEGGGGDWGDEPGRSAMNCNPMRSH